MNKKYFLTIILILTLSFVFGETAFNSFAGTSLDLGPRKEKKGIALNVNGAFAGQYTLDNSFTLRGHFLVKTQDVFENGIFQDTTATFTIKELSATYRFLTENINQQASVFIGEFESFGSDSFVKKYFGTKNLTSPVLLPELGLDTNGMFPFDGAGLAYSIKLASPKAFGLYFYYNKTKTEETQEDGKISEIDTKRINGDFRFSSAWDFLVLDTDFGVSLPMETTIKHGTESTEDDEEVILLIRYAELRGGVSMLLGNNPITNLFLQFGLQNITLDPAEKNHILSLDNIYLFMEPRFTTEYVKCNVAFFCLPQKTLKNLKYIKNPVGCSLTFASQPIMLFGNNADFGCHFTVSSAAALDNMEIKSFDMQISPYLNLYVFGGTFEVSSNIYPQNFKKNKEFFTISLGYRAYLW